MFNILNHANFNTPNLIVAVLPPGRLRLRKRIRRRADHEHVNDFPPDSVRAEAFVVTASTSSEWTQHSGGIEDSRDDRVRVSSKEL